MAMKDWKNSGRDYWQNINPHTSNRTLIINSDNSVIAETHLYSGRSVKLFEKQFKTKKAAFKFAKEYMEKH